MNTNLENLLSQIRDRWNGASDSAEGGPSATASAAPPSVALYAAGAATQISGLMAAAYQIAEPSFTYFTVTLTIIGVAVAYFARRMGVSSRALRGGAILLGLVFLSALRGAGLFGTLVPPESHGSQEILLVSALAFTATFCSFLLVTDEAVVFTCVWAIAIIGLTGTVEINRPLLIAFVFFLISATFLLIHQNSLTQSIATARNPNGRLIGGSQTIESAPALSWPLLRTQIGMAIAVWATALLLGFCISIPVQMVGRNLSLGAIIQRLRVPTNSPNNRLQGLVTLSFDNLNQFNVGLGPVYDDPAERMSVLSDGPQYWRGRVYDFYNGHGWESSYAVARYQVSPTGTPRPVDNWNRFDVPQSQDEPKREKVERITNRFRLINSSGFGPLYHAAEPVQVFAPIDTVSARPDHTIGAGRTGGNGSEYEVVSEISSAKPSDLRNSGRSYGSNLSIKYINQGVNNDALQMLADEAVGDFTDPFGKAQAIKRFIGARCTYSREARAVPQNRDAVEFFLNESHEGYCDLYASAMAVLCRYAGLPARVATGFAPGTPLTEAEVGPDGKPEKRTRYMLRGSDLHAWAEVYFNGYGWIRFDPTEETGSIAPPPTTPKPVAAPSSLWRRIQREKIPLALVTAGLLGILFTLANEFRGRLRLRGGPRIGAANKVDKHAQEVSLLYAQAVRLVEKKAKARRARTATTGEYARFVKDQFGETGAASDAFGDLTRLAEQALYGPQTIGETEVRASHKALRALRSGLRHAKGTTPDAARS